MFDFRRAPVFYLGHHFSKNKMTGNTKNWEGMAPGLPLATPMIHAPTVEGGRTPPHLMSTQHKPTCNSPPSKTADIFMSRYKMHKEVIVPQRNMVKLGKQHNLGTLCTQNCKCIRTNVKAVRE